MAKNAEATVLSTLQDLLIFQMASKGVPQGQIREAVWDHQLYASVDSPLFMRLQ